MKRNHVIGVVVAVLVAAGGSFYGGMIYAKGQTPARGQFGQFQGGTGGTFAGRAGAGGTGARGGFTAGKILSSSNGSLTIQAMNGSSTEIVLVSDSTQVLKTTSGSSSDLTPGTDVVVTGSQNSDGSLTAQSIQVRPMGTMGFGRSPQAQ